MTTTETKHTIDERTIPATDAATLFAAPNGSMTGPWCRAAAVLVGSGSVRESWRLILRHDDDTYWALDFARGVAGSADHSYPWLGTTGPLPLFPVRRTEYLAVRYDRTSAPSPAEAVPEDLVDRAYEVLYAALGQHQLLHCAITEQYPPPAVHGLESGHVHDIAHRIVTAIRQLDPTNGGRR